MRLVRLAVVFVMVAALVVLAGCQQNRTQADVKDQVEKSFEQARLDNINVDSDAEHKTLTLKGEVKTDADKQRAEELARSAAAGWTIANEIAVRPEGAAGDRAEDVGSAEDKAIKASLDAEYEKANIKDAGFDYDVNNGVVTLTGNVQNSKQKQQAETLAKKVKDVEQVVNNIEIGRDALPASDQGARADTDQKKEDVKKKD
jgi:osmotically-inducible protein OsmY